jgi:hypothetical protein
MIGQHRKEGVLLRNDAGLGKASFEGRRTKQRTTSSEKIEKENERNSACNNAQNLRLWM